MAIFEGIITSVGLLDGHLTTRYDEYYIEPADRYFNNLNHIPQNQQNDYKKDGDHDFHSVIYSTSVVNFPNIFTHGAASPFSGLKLYPLMNLPFSGYFNKLVNESQNHNTQNHNNKLNDHKHNVKGTKFDEKRQPLVMMIVDQFDYDGQIELLDNVEEMLHLNKNNYYYEDNKLTTRQQRTRRSIKQLQKSDYPSPSSSSLFADSSSASLEDLNTTDHPSLLMAQWSYNSNNVVHQSQSQVKSTIETSTTSASSLSLIHSNHSKTTKMMINESDFDILYNDQKNINIKKITVSTSSSSSLLRKKPIFKADHFRKVMTILSKNNLDVSGSNFIINGYNEKIINGVGASIDDDLKASGNGRYWRDMDSLHYTESEPYGIKAVHPRTHWIDDQRHHDRHVVVDPKKTTCMLYLQADHLFFEKMGSEEACIESMTRHVQKVNNIYKNTGKNLSI